MVHQAMSSSAPHVKLDLKSIKLDLHVMRVGLMKSAPCAITSTDGKIPGQVDDELFVYAGDAEALKEGRFDRKLWARQKGEICKLTGKGSIAEFDGVQRL